MFLGIIMTDGADRAGVVGESPAGLQPIRPGRKPCGGVGIEGLHFDRPPSPFPLLPMGYTYTDHWVTSNNHDESGLS